MAPQGVLDDDVDGVKKHGVRRRFFLADPVLELLLRNLETCCEFGVSPNRSRRTLKGRCVIQ